MRLTPSFYGTLVATAFLGGVAIYYQTRPTIQAVDVVEIVEGTLERTAAVLAWPITGTYQEDEYQPNAGWGYYATTNPATNYSYMAVYPNPPVIGSGASRDLLVKTMGIIEQLPPSFVKSYTATSIVYWTGTGLWSACGIADGIYSNWTIAITNGIPIYGPATNLSYIANTAVLFEAYRLLAKMTQTAYVVTIDTTGKLYGAVADDVEYYREESVVFGEEEEDPPFPESMDWALTLDTNTDTLAETLIGTVAPSAFAQSDGSPGQRNNRLQGYFAGEGPEGRGAYYYAHIDTRMISYAERTPLWAPYTWHVTSRGMTFYNDNLPCERREQKSQGYLRLSIADLGPGVKASIDVSVASTGRMDVLTGVDWGDGTRLIAETRPPLALTNYTWTETCAGSITGLVRTGEVQFAPTIRDYFTGFPANVQGNIAPSYDGGYTYDAGGQDTAQTLVEASMWYIVPRRAVVKWQFIFCTNR